MSPRALDYLLSLASGVLLTLSFPRFGHAAFGWIALAPLLVALSPNALSHGRTAQSLSLPRAFALGLTAGAVYFTGTLYWITGVMAMYGGLQTWVAVMLNGLLIAYLALFPALFAMVMRHLVVSQGPLLLMVAPIVWVATELGRTHVFTGFPWVLLGYSQVAVLPVAQFASLFGVYGVSGLVAAVSAAAAFAVVGGAGAGPRIRSHQTIAAGLVAATLLVVAMWGSRRAAQAEWTRTGDPIRVGLIQGNVEQADKWDPARAGSILAAYIRMTREAIGQGAQFLIWPESSYSFTYFADTPQAEHVRTLARQARVSILLGSDEISRGAGGLPDAYYNSSFLVRSDGATAGTYRKMHLVPFGEYVPMRRLLFFAAPLVEAVGFGFAAGERPDLLPVDGHRVSVAICYEIVYPDLVRQFVRGGSELLTTITNDAWFGQTSAPYQHFAQASMRAIEEGRYLVRSANTGISGIIDPYGRVLAQSDIFQPAIIVGEARFLETSTLYTRIGDVFAYASVVVTALMLTLARRRVE